MEEKGIRSGFMRSHLVLLLFYNLMKDSLRFQTMPKCYLEVFFMGLQKERHLNNPKLQNEILSAPSTFR